MPFPENPVDSSRLPCYNDPVRRRTPPAPSAGRKGASIMGNNRMGRILSGVLSAALMLSLAPAALAA